jgi:hypothetical protein
MHFEEVNDDLAIPIKRFKVIACLPVLGRLPLLEHTIRRLYEKNKCHKVICSGDGALDRELCTSLGAVWVQSSNKPLGQKWNKAFQKAQEYSPDAVVYVGSSDFLSDNWLSVMETYVKEKHFVGVAGCHFIDIGKEKLRGVYWSGYKDTKYHKDRGDETIGIGRMLSSSLMDKLDWKPFNDLYDNSLDRSMKEKCKKAGIDDFMVNENVKAVSISTHQWINKHRFEQHWDGEPEANKRLSDVDGFVSEFPEIKQIFK